MIFWNHARIKSAHTLNNYSIICTFASQIAAGGEMPQTHSNLIE